MKSSRKENLPEFAITPTDAKPPKKNLGCVNGNREEYCQSNPCENNFPEKIKKSNMKRIFFTLSFHNYDFLCIKLRIIIVNFKIINSIIQKAEIKKF